MENIFGKAKRRRWNANENQDFNFLLPSGGHLPKRLWHETGRGFDRHISILIRVDLWTFGLDFHTK